jgi:DNA polymerase-3 subunit epsilon
VMALHRVAIVDTETTTLDPATGACVEVGLVVWDVATKAVERCFSDVLPAASNPAESVNGIPAKLLASLGGAPEAARVWKRFEALSEGCDAYVAHNADFDRDWLPNGLAMRFPWICSMSDVDWPRAPQYGPAKSVVNLCLSHGVGVVHAHRAIADCLSIAAVLTRCAELGHDVEAMLGRGLRPKVLVHSTAPFKDKDAVKDAGFHWDGAAKVWWRSMPEEDIGALPFATKIVSPTPKTSGGPAQTSAASPTSSPAPAKPRDWVAEAAALKEQMVEAKRDPLLLAAAEQALRKFNESCPEELGIEIVRFFNLVRG